MSKHHHHEICQCGGACKGNCKCALKENKAEGLFGESGGSWVLILIFIFLIFGWLGGDVF